MVLETVLLILLVCYSVYFAFRNYTLYILVALSNLILLFRKVTYEYMGLKKVKTVHAHGEIYHLYKYHNCDFILIDGHGDLPDVEYIRQCDNLKFSIVFFTINLRELEYIDATEDVRKFTHYMNNNHPIGWYKIISYCLRGLSKEHWLKDDSVVEIHYNDEDMTSKRIKIKDLVKYQFSLSPMHSFPDEEAGRFSDRDRESCSSVTAIPDADDACLSK